jgi:Flp pilus assembly pilin Flp
MLSRIWKDEEGLTTVEYALLLALLVVAAITVWTTFGGTVRSAVSQSDTAIEGAMTPPAG